MSDKQRSHWPLAVAGIVILVLNFLSSGEKSPGVTAMPFALILFARTAMLAYVIAATIILWNRARILALVFAGINLVQILGFAQSIARDTWEGIPVLMAHELMMNSAIPGLQRFADFIVGLVLTVTKLVLYVWVIVRLFMKGTPRPASPADGLNEESPSRDRAGKGAVLVGLGAFLGIVLLMSPAMIVRAGRISRTPLARHPTLRGMYAVQGSFEVWAKQNGGAYPYPAEFDSDSSRFMKFLARDRVG